MEHREGANMEGSMIDAHIDQVAQEETPIKKNDFIRAHALFFNIPFLQFS